MLGGHLLHGGDYNPEQWLDCPEILEEDIRLMKEAGVNCVTPGRILIGQCLSRKKGAYDFDWLEEIIDNLGESGYPGDPCDAVRCHASLADAEISGGDAGTRRRAEKPAGKTA